MLYILGYGRSGSTVLGMALGQHPDIVNVGEVVALPSFLPEHRPDDRACGCLQPIEVCPFWREVAAQVPLGRHTGVPTSGGWRHYAPWLPPLGPELEPWGRANAAFFAAVTKAAGASLAIDGSKRADRAWWLWASGAVDLIPLWLTRERAAVVRSERKHGRWGLKAATHWHVAQRRAVQLVRSVEGKGGQVVRGTYEEMTEDPRGFLGRILAELGLPWNEAILQPRPAHVIGGEHAAKHGGRLTIERKAA